MLDQRSMVSSKVALGGLLTTTQPGAPGATIGNTISTVVHSSPYHDDPHQHYRLYQKDQQNQNSISMLQSIDEGKANNYFSKHDFESLDGENED